jgi:hypothetical protein
MTKTVFITGASSGIGEALAYEFAHRGYNLAITARREVLLEHIATHISQTLPHCRVEVYPLDVTNYASITPVFESAVSALGHIDKCIVNAGVFQPGEVGNAYFDTAKQIVETNLLGAIATIEPAVSHFKQRGRGQLVGISSITAFRGLPTAAAYSASKIALSAYLEATRIELNRTNVKVTVLYPGFIETPMIQNTRFHPFQISVRRAAYLMANLIENGVEEATVPRIPWALLGPLLKGVPRRVIHYFTP